MYWKQRFFFSQMPEAVLTTIIRRRRYFPFPLWEELDGGTKAVATAAQAAWDEIASFPNGVEWPDSEPAPHPLIAWVSPGPLHQAPIRSVVERQALQSLHPMCSTVLNGATPGLFIELLEAVATTVTNSAASLRQVSLVTTPDAQGVRIGFPPAETLHGRLGRLHHFICSAQGPNIFTAAVALVAMTNAHPFIDGNGRSARALFNLVMNRHRAHPDIFALPLHDLGNRPPGNLTLYMRGAELHGDWRSLLDFLFKSIASGRVVADHASNG